MRRDSATPTGPGRRTPSISLVSHRGTSSTPAGKRRASNHLPSHKRSQTSISKEKNLEIFAPTTLFCHSMKKFFLMLQLAALSAGSSAFAITGGPFENSDAGILLERGGFYQATYSFRNGSGYAIWTPDAQWFSGGATGTDYRRTTLITPATNRTFSDHNGNRSVLYYKGVTYVGGAFGEVDVDSRTIQGFSNCESEFGVTTSTQTTNANLLSFSQTSGVTSAAVVVNNRNYVANASWTGKIYQRAPILRFRGKGELFIISANGSETIANLAYTAYQGLINAIITAVATVNSSNALATINPALFTEAQTAIDNLLVDLPPYIQGAGPNNSYNEGEKERLRVRGLRRFF